MFPGVAKLAGNKPKMFCCPGSFSPMPIYKPTFEEVWGDFFSLQAGLFPHIFWPCDTIFWLYSSSLHELHLAYKVMTNSLSSSFQILYFFSFSSTSTSPAAIIVCLPQQHWYQVNSVFVVAKLGKICFESNICVREAKMFLTSGKNIFLFPQHVSHVAKLGNICLRNNVSPTIFPSLARPLGSGHLTLK